MQKKYPNKKPDFFICMFVKTVASVYKPGHSPNSKSLRHTPGIASVGIIFTISRLRTPKSLHVDAL